MVTETDESKSPSRSRGNTLVTVKTENKLSTVAKFDHWSELQNRHAVTVEDLEHIIVL